jgi:hypothetical protein
LRLFAGIGWAGTYMPGLKAIADPLEGTAQSCARCKDSDPTRTKSGSQVTPRWREMDSNLRFLVARPSTVGT